MVDASISHTGSAPRRRSRLGLPGTDCSAGQSVLATKKSTLARARPRYAAASAPALGSRRPPPTGLFLLSCFQRFQQFRESAFRSKRIPNTSMPRVLVQFWYSSASERPLGPRLHCRKTKWQNKKRNQILSTDSPVLI